ncbi:MAG: hypothetical protein ACLGHL_01910 [Actinomycetota bacterium]
MKTRRTLLIGLVVLVLGGGATLAIASNDEGGRDDDATERPITGAALTEASEAALDFTGGGEVTDTEVGDEESYYEVEVTMPDGTQIDVQLDEDFKVVGSETETGPEDD